MLSNAKDVEALRWVKTPVLDDGFVTLVDVMGDDAAIVQAARVSYNNDKRDGDTTVNDTDESLIRYLMRHTHTTPFEMAELKFLVRVPMDCWRQWIRHRMASVNEYSTRYTTAIDSKQKTPNDEWRRQSTNNKQGSSGSLEEWPKGWTCEEIVEHGQPGWRVSHGENFTWDIMKNMVDGKMTPGAFLTLMERSHHDKDNQLYTIRLDLGVAKEQARKDLPLSTYTEAYWKIDLHNLMHFLRLRMDSHAQKEIRDYANAIAKIVQQLFPTTWAAFEDYVINAMKLTARDTEVIRRLVASGEKFPIAAPAPEDGCWPEAWHGIARCRERDECVVKLQHLMILNKP